ARHRPQRGRTGLARATAGLAHLSGHTQQRAQRRSRLARLPPAASEGDHRAAGAAWQYRRSRRQEPPVMTSRRLISYLGTLAVLGLLAGCSGGADTTTATDDDNMVTVT